MLNSVTYTSDNQKKINDKFDSTGSVLDLQGRGRKRSARSVDNVSRVKVVFDKSLKNHQQERLLS